MSLLCHIGAYTHSYIPEYQYCHFRCLNIRSDVERNILCLMFWRQTWCWQNSYFCFWYFLSF